VSRRDYLLKDPSILQIKQVGSECHSKMYSKILGIEVMFIEK
jgi:hypothetical protein